MICSRCQATNIPGDAVVCPNCGGTLVSEEAPRPPMPEELERRADMVVDGPEGALALLRSLL